MGLIFRRAKHGPQEFVPEGLFDDSIDLVIWGHEHDCRIIPEPVAGKSYYISQPGSSVATSLADGEAIEKSVSLSSLVFKSNLRMQTRCSPANTGKRIPADPNTAANCATVRLGRCSVERGSRRGRVRPFRPNGHLKILEE